MDVIHEGQLGGELNCPNPRYVSRSQALSCPSVPCGRRASTAQPRQSGPEPISSALQAEQDSVQYRERVGERWSVNNSGRGGWGDA